MANSSGSSSRKASWPLSDSISTKLTLAATAFSACTISRLSRVGYSQSLVNETTQKRVLRALEGVGQHVAVLGGQIEIVDRPRDVEIAVGVEAIDEGRALVAQIALDLEVGVEAEALGRQVLQVAAELALQRLLGQVGDVRGHARDGEAVARLRAELQIAALRASPDRPSPPAARPRGRRCSARSARPPWRSARP